jgi:hypothetical protein
MADTAAQTETVTEPAAEAAMSDVARRVAELRKVAQSSPATAADAAWGWFRELGDRAKADRESGTADLDELFRLGNAPTAIDGQTEGILVVPLIQPLLDKGLGLLTGAWMPWLGKRFDRGAQLGDNTLTSSTRFVGKLLWPLYGMREYGSNLAAFDFETRVEPGKLDPGTDVLVIDYFPIEKNPNFIIRSIRDELVEITPGANLGKILWRSGDDDYTNIGFFALRSTNA